MRARDSVRLYESISYSTFFLGRDHDDQKQNLSQRDKLGADFVNTCGQLVRRVVLNELISELSKYLQNLQEGHDIQFKNIRLQNFGKPTVSIDMSGKVQFEKPEERSNHKQNSFCYFVNVRAMVVG
jgi:hypothetical protein